MGGSDLLQRSRRSGLRALVGVRAVVHKLMCIFEIFGLVDCAAELVVKYPEHIGDEGSRTEVLDLLASEQTGVETTYAELQERFAQDARARFAPNSP